MKPRITFLKPINLVSAIVFITLMTSCASARRLQKSLIHKVVPIGYFYDTDIKETPKIATVAITQFNDAALEPVTTVKKKGEFLVPLLFINYWEATFVTKIGKQSLDQDFNLFYKNAFKTESERSGCFFAIENPIESDYTLELQFETCQAQAKYRKSTTILILGDFESTDENERCFPAKGTFKFNAILKHNGNKLFNKTYTFNSEIPFYGGDFGHIGELRTAYLNNMAIALSQTAKQSIEALVSDINFVIEADKLKDTNQHPVIIDGAVNKVIIVP